MHFEVGDEHGEVMKYDGCHMKILTPFSVVSNGKFSLSSTIFDD